jgi:hypothetical protein
MPNRLPYGLTLPEVPFVLGNKKPPLDAQYARKLHESLRSMNVGLANRIEELIQYGTNAELPAATGGGRIFWETDTNILKVDDGAWDPVGGAGAFLPLAAGSGSPLTGDLHIENASPAIFLDTSTDLSYYTKLEDSGTVAYLRKVRDSGNASIEIDAIPEDGSGNASIKLFNTTNTTGDVDLIIMSGDASAVEQHRFEGDTGHVFLCQDDGTLTLEGDGKISIEAASGPSYMVLKAGGSSTDYAEFYQFSNKLDMRMHNNGAAYMYMDPMADDGTSEAGIYLFQNTSTTGAKFLRLEEGDLYLDATSNPSILLRENGSTTNYSYIQDQDTTSLNIRKVKASGIPVIRMDPIASDGTSNVQVTLFRSTNTSGEPALTIYKGDGTGTVQHNIEARSGDVTLCNQSGNVTIEEGNLYLEKTVSPTIYLRENGSTTEYSSIYDDGARLRIDRKDPDGHCYIDMNPDSDHGAGGGFLQLGRSSNNAIGILFRIFEGDGTTTYNHSMRSSGYDTELCLTGGDLLLCDGGGNVDLTGGANALIVPYLGAAPSGLTNGMVWMESDGLHIYYAGAEKTVAGV